MKKLIIATNNQGKVKEFKAMLGEYYDEILSLKDVGINVDVVEDGETFHQNSAKKAVEISKLVEGDVLADDSGLCVDALDGAPGIYSARFSGENATDEENNAKLLQLMATQPNKKARFVCALVLANNGKELLSVEDFTEGTILDSPRGESGFGYDPLFFNEEHGKTFAELSLDVKNQISHRARALRRLQQELASRA
ncbi:XTP/dITP diphosphatase [Christensenellaceae bacterium OttesenSCG-928-K19]|nr:XTP/dITP diphosphatase [Christensenellaceae bacterium OttesenSCG-928-K19]